MSILTTFIVLFGLFDFNELNSLSVMDLEFMISSCLSSTFKITEVPHDVDKETITKFLSESFLQDSRINISQLIKYLNSKTQAIIWIDRWCAKSPEIHEFFSIIKKEMALVRTLIAHTSMHAGLSKVIYFFSCTIRFCYIVCYFISNIM